MLGYRRGSKAAVTNRRFRLARRFLLSLTPVSLIPPQVGATGALLFGSFGSPTSRDRLASYASTILPGAQGGPEACSTASGIHRRSSLPGRSVSGDAASLGLGQTRRARGRLRSERGGGDGGDGQSGSGLGPKEPGIGLGPFGMMPSACSPRKTKRGFAHGNAETSQACLPRRRARGLAVPSALSVKISVSPRLGSAGNSVSR